jgi:hypothetical protein
MDMVELKKVLDEKGMDWLIAAMVEGSIGYHSPKHARIVIERALAGETKDYCERCMACFGTDILAMIESDVKRMERLEEKSPERFKRVMDTVKQITGLTPEQQQIAGLMYPTTV